ncbi:hypothetical protein SAMN05216420_106115 [Nitrosospira sp. Nl5]|nr:hypothetical protein SAMN05216420_106115 [Nitrosospira sp. Nl5]
MLPLPVDNTRAQLLITLRNDQISGQKMPLSALLVPFRFRCNSSGAVHDVNWANVDVQPVEC